jgi:hypothetical protein
VVSEMKAALESYRPSTPLAPKKNPKKKEK